MKPRISTIVITYNEQDNIERCLKSVAPFSSEVIVVDSNSTDRTVELATPLATRVVTQDWLGYGPQKQFAVEQATGDWVFSIDADEEVSPELSREILSLDFAASGYHVARRVWYLGRWITHSGWHPGYVMRLFRRDRGRFSEDRVHEYVRVEGETHRLKGDLLHYSYRDVAHHIEKINQFTTLSAEKMHHKGRRAWPWQLSITPVLSFFRVYVLRAGFLDGRAGVLIALLHSYYVFLKYAKLWELRSGNGRAPEST